MYNTEHISDLKYGKQAQVKEITNFEISLYTGKGNNFHTFKQEANLQGRLFSTSDFVSADDSKVAKVPYDNQ